MTITLSRALVERTHDLLHNLIGIFIPSNDGAHQDTADVMRELRDALAQQAEPAVPAGVDRMALNVAIRNVTLEDAAQRVQKRAEGYDAEHGNTDPETGTREYPGDGAEYVYELQEIADDIRSMKTEHAGGPMDDMPALIRHLVHALRKAAPSHDLPAKALDYLKRHGLQGSPLRAAPPTPPAEPSPAPDATPAPVEAVLYQYRRKVRFNGQAGEWDDISHEDYLAIQKEIAAEPESRFEVRRLFAEPVRAAPSTTPQEAPAYTHADVTDAHAKGYALGLAQKDRAQEAPEGLTAKEMQAHWDAQRTYHGGEPFKLGHLEFGRAVAAATIAKVKPS